MEKNDNVLNEEISFLKKGLKNVFMSFYTEKESRNVGSKYTILSQSSNFSN